MAGGVNHLDEAFVALAQHARQRNRGVIVHHVGHHRGAVVIALHRAAAVGMEALGRKAAAAGVHRLVEQPAHLTGLGVGGFARFSLLHAHHPGQQRRQRHIRKDVDALGTAIDAVEEFGKGDPVPRQPGLHRRIGNRFHARHGQHRALAILGMHRGEAETAVADYNRSDPVPTGNRTVGIPEQLGVIVGVKVDKSGRDNRPGRVDDALGGVARKPPDFGDLAVLDPEIGAEPRHPRSIDNQSISDDRIELCHRASPRMSPTQFYGLIELLAPIS